MSNSPPTKKAKTSADGAEKSWREKSIEKFGLLPIPDGWKNSVAVGSENAWERYYNYRVKIESEDPRNDSDDRYNSDGDSISDEEDPDKEGLKSVIFSWAEFGIMDETEKLMADGCKWQWTPQRPTLRWEDESKLRYADYYSHVWSPYAIPRAIDLAHSWYFKVGWNSSCK